MNCPKCNMYSEPGTAKCDCGYLFLPTAVEPEESFFKKTGSKGTASIIFNIFGFKNRPIPKTLLLFSAALLIVTYFLKDRLPDVAEISPQLYVQPVQKKKDVPPPFDTVREKITYTVKPLYSYELYGLVVSYHDSDAFLDYYHEKWKDYLNIKDLCVIWGRNIKTGVYKEMEFSSRDFTCHYQYPNAMVKSLFREACLSNNHILADKVDLEDKIMSVRTGDQVYFKGYLVEYGHKTSSFRRKTSESRLDVGNTACEVVYVTDFRILKRANMLLRSLFSLSIYAIIGILIFLLVDMHISQPGPGDGTIG